MNGMEAAFAWIRDELHAGESIESISAEGCSDEEVRSFILILVRQNYDKSAPPKEAIDMAEARAREVLEAMHSQRLELEVPKERPAWRRCFRLIEVVYHPDEVEAHPEHTDLATLARMIEEGTVHGGEIVSGDIPEMLAKELILFEGIVDEEDALNTPAEKG